MSRHILLCLNTKFHKDNFILVENFSRQKNSNKIIIKQKRYRNFFVVRKTKQKLFNREKNCFFLFKRKTANFVSKAPFKA